MRYVLLIDDHGESCSTLKALLEVKNFRAECVGTMKAAREMIAEKNRSNIFFDLIVSDLCLPDSTAQETLNWLRDLNMPVRAISGINDPEIIELAVACGIKLITKGTSAEGILESIFYAFLERKPDPAAAKAIADVRSRPRELQAIMPTTGIARLFAILPRWAQIAAAIATIAGIMSTAVGATSVMYQRIYHKGATAEQANTKADINTARLDEVDARSEKNSTIIRELQDHNLIIDGEFKSLNGKLDVFRDDINHRLDRVFDQVKKK